MKSLGASEPSPKKYFSISVSKNFRSLASIGVNRFSLISMVWWPSQPCHASLQTPANIRCPNSPGYGARDRASPSRSNFTHCIVFMSSMIAAP